MKLSAAFKHGLIAATAFSYVFGSAAVAKDLTCSTLEDCLEETQRILPIRKGAEYKNSYFSRDISKAFVPFGQEGFDAVFNLATDAQGEERAYLLQALWDLRRELNDKGPNKGNDTDKHTVKISEAQYETLIKLWANDTDFTLIRLINSADTPRSHSFIIQALKAPDEERRHSAEQLLQLDILGDSNSPVAAKHLGDILSLLETTDNSGVLDILDRLEGEAAQKAMWSVLESPDQTRFQTAFAVLKDRDSKRLYAHLRKLEFQNTAEDRARAVMIAQVITQQRRNIRPTQKTFTYWKNWYGETGPESAAHLIPSYLIFSFHEKTANKVAGFEKTQADQKRWLEHTLKNPEGRKGRLSEAELTKSIAKAKADGEALFPLLENTSAFINANETRSVEAYFDIIETHAQDPLYEPFGGWQLPFPKVLETSMQSPALWVDRFETFLDCSPNSRTYALVTQIAKLDSHNAQLKTCFLTQLQNEDDIPKLMETLSRIATFESYQQDPDIRKAVTAIDTNSPFTSLRSIQAFALAESTSDEPLGRGRHLWRGPLYTKAEEINKTRNYCEAESKGTFDYLPNSPDFQTPPTSIYIQAGKPIMTVQTPSGYLTGHDRGEFGGGLFYYPDETSKAVQLYDGNMIAIIESDTEGVYWGVSGLNHLMPGTGKILHIDARTDDVKLERHKHMPIVTRNVTSLENGDLFMDFWRRNYVSYENGVEKTNTVPSWRHNPPVILTKAGELISGCED